MRLPLPFLFWKLALPALLVVVLYGWVERRQVWLVLIVGVLWRWMVLWREHRRPVMKEADWLHLREGLIQVELARLEGEPETRGAPPQEQRDRAVQNADHEMTGLRLQYRPPREGVMLLAEALALPVFVIGLPVLMLMIASDFFTFRRRFGWEDMMVILGCAVLFSLPHLRFFRQLPSLVAKVWWLAPAFMVPLAILDLVRDKHPYWNPFHPEQRRLAAEKVLSLQDWVLAAAHADWVFRHAEDLAARGRTEDARKLGERAMQMAPGSPRGRHLQVRLGNVEPAAAPGMEIDAHAPYLADGTRIPRAERCRFETAHGLRPECVTLLLPVGEVPDLDLDFVAEVLRKETGMPTKVYEKSLPLPAPTRTLGLLQAKQWDLESIVKTALPEMNGRRVRGPFKILVITSADMYRESANYIFAVGYEWGGVVSRARFTWGDNPWLTRHRLAKQCYSMIIKSFGIMPSADTRCVTSYPDGLQAFDAKGNRPLPDVRRQFLESLARLNRSAAGQVR
ncbi:MAG: hypothetical protein CJBNEKGG_03113 [Prosthecobacter sp.]|nr:hypothetical protein [Prosthecobacter sp.]